MEFPEANVTHLQRINSDHSPILVSTTSKHIPNPDAKSFTFQSMWLEEKGFQNIFINIWPKEATCITHKIVEFTEKLQVWNKEEFDYILNQSIEKKKKGRRRRKKKVACSLKRCSESYGPKSEVVYHEVK